MNTIDTDVHSRVVRSLGLLPPFSPVLNQLLASMAREDMSFAELAKLIEKDTVMSGNVLRLVNSAAYACRGRIHSISHAISVLGLQRLRNAVLGLSISRMWASVKTPRGWSPLRFNLHSIATALLSDLLAQRIPVDYPEGAFAGGLFHDIGQLLIAVAMPTEYQEIVQLYAVGGRTRSECEREILGVDHGALSAIALTEWNLPVPIRSAVEFHHARTEEKTRLSELIQTADDTVNGLGISIEIPNDETPIGLRRAEITERILEEFQRDYDAIRTFF